MTTNSRITTNEYSILIREFVVKKYCQYFEFTSITASNARKQNLPLTSLMMRVK